MTWVFNPFTGTFDFTGGGGGDDNFSYEVVTTEVTIPLYQQMAVFGGIIIDGGTLNIDGTLVLQP